MKNFLILLILSVGAIIAGTIILKPWNSNVAQVPAKAPALEHVHGLAVDVYDPERLLIATHHGLMEFKKGTISPIGTNMDDLMGFTTHSINHEIFYSSGHSIRGGNLGFQKSTDGGKTWTKVSNGLNGPVDFHSMTISQLNPDLVYGYFGSLQHSKDGGKTWQLMKGAIQPYSLSTDPQKENVVYAPTQNGVQMSEDYGDTWRSYSVSLENGAVSVFSVNPTGEYALAFSQILGGLVRTSNQGKVWERLTESFEGKAILFLAFSKTEPSTVYALNQLNSIFKSMDEGTSWSKIH